MVRPPGRAAPRTDGRSVPETKTPLEAPSGVLSRVRIQRAAAARLGAEGERPRRPPRALRAAASHFSGPKSALRRVGRPAARSGPGPTPTAVDPERAEAEGRRRVPPSSSYFSLCVPRLSNKMIRKGERLEGERGKGAK